MGTSGKVLRVLIVDDNHGDLRLLKEAFRTTGTPTEVVTADDGTKALALLHRADVPRPDIVILDINMPGVSGYEVLRDIKRSNELRSTIVFMFSSSSSEPDIEEAYDCRANGYVTKPMALDDYFNVARSVTDFWWRVATLPQRTPLQG
jgi:CheY-like chemotaxis protein